MDRHKTPLRPAARTDTNSDQFGRYHSSGIAPGAYKLFVWSDVEPEIWFDPDLLKGADDSGKPVTLDPKGRQSVNPRPASAQ